MEVSEDGDQFHMYGFGVNQARDREKQINGEVFPSGANRQARARLAELSAAICDRGHRWDLLLTTSPLVAPSSARCRDAVKSGEQ